MNPRTSNIKSKMHLKMRTLKAILGLRELNNEVNVTSAGTLKKDYNDPDQEKVWHAVIAIFAGLILLEIIGQINLI